MIDFGVVQPGDWEFTLYSSWQDGSHGGRPES